MLSHTKRRSHLFSVRMDPELFEAVREALAIDHPPSRPRDGVAVYAWSNLIEQVLTDWLAQQQARRSARQ